MLSNPSDETFLLQIPIAIWLKSTRNCEKLLQALVKEINEIETFHKNGLRILFIHLDSLSFT